MNSLLEADLRMDGREAERRRIPRIWGGTRRTEPIRPRGGRGGCVQIEGIPGRHNWWCRTAPEARRMATEMARRLGPNYTVDHDVRPRPHYHVVRLIWNPVTRQWSRRRRGGDHYFYGGRRPYPLSPRRPQREGDLEHEEEISRAAERFVVKTLTTPEGHERLTREAAAGLPGISAPALRAMIEGVRRVDTGSLTDHFRASQQRRHALRKDVCQPLRAALSDTRNHLILLYNRAMRAGTPRDRFAYIGEALHLIQDSYSAAHVERAWGGRGGRHPILYIRFFGLRGGRYPLEHRVFPPPDPRDIITGPGGVLTPWARESVTASSEFLRLMLRHFASPSAPSTRRSSELRAFMDRHLMLSPQRTEPGRYYPRCR